MTFLLYAALVLGSRAHATVKSDAVDALFAAYNRGSVPGASVIVIRDGKVLYRHAYGFADLEEHVSATTATNYRLASVTKQFTAMAILMLADRKRLSLDDNLTSFFPDYPAYGKQITVRQLLTHTSGLKAYEDLIPAEQTAQVKDLDVLELLKRQTATYFPRDRSGATATPATRISR